MNRVYFGPDRRRKDDAYKGKERRERLFGPRSWTIREPASGTCRLMRHGAVCANRLIDDN